MAVFVNKQGYISLTERGRAAREVQMQSDSQGRIPREYALDRIDEGRHGHQHACTGQYSFTVSFLDSLIRANRYAQVISRDDQFSHGLSGFPLGSA